MFTRLTVVAVTLVLTLGAMLGVTATASASTTGVCANTWGSLPKDSPMMATGEVQAIRVGRHACFDRLVIDVDGVAGGWHAAYVPQVTADGSGQVVATPGGAKIQFMVRHPWFSGPRVGMSVANVSGFSTFRSVVYAGSFEGQTTFGVGVRARLPMRVFALAGPGGHSRIVLDVARRWS